MADEKNAFPFRGQVFHDLHQLIDFLRSQHGCRFVKNQNVIITVQHLQDFDPLLHSDRNIFDFRIKIYLEPIFFTQGFHLLAGCLSGQESAFGILCSQNDIVQHRKNIDQLEMLVNHAYIECGRIIGAADPDHLTVLADLPLFRLIQTKEDAHQRGFPGAVLPQKSVDFTFFQLKRNVIIGYDTGKFFRDMDHFYHIFRTPRLVILHMTASSCLFLFSELYQIP